VSGKFVMVGPKPSRHPLTAPSRASAPPTTPRRDERHDASTARQETTMTDEQNEEHARRYFNAAVTRVLTKTPVAQWRHLAIRVDSESGDASISDRGGLVSFLAANDLPELANEARTRKVPAGCVLALIMGRERTYLRVLFSQSRST
jgi:hypothetical protein